MEERRCSPRILILGPVALFLVLALTQSSVFSGFDQSSVIIGGVTKPQFSPFLNGSSSSLGSMFYKTNISDLLSKLKQSREGMQAIKKMERWLESQKNSSPSSSTPSNNDQSTPLAPTPTTPVASQGQYWRSLNNTMKEILRLVRRNILDSQKPRTLISVDSKVYVIHPERGDGHLLYMYHPFVRTVLEGFEVFGVNATHVYDRNYGNAVKRMTAQVKANDAVILVGSIRPDGRMMSAMKKKGAYTILYQTEPLLIGNPAACSPAHYTWFFDEIWDYSLAHIDMLCQCAGRTAFPLIRYVPITYWKDSPKLRYAPPKETNNSMGRNVKGKAPAITSSPSVSPIISSSSPTPQTPKPPPPLPQSPPSPPSSSSIAFNPKPSFLFFGAPFYGREECWKRLNLIGDIAKDLRSEYTIWSAPAFEKFVKSSDSAIFLNMHKTCILGKSHPTDFINLEPRVSILMSAHALIVSSHSYWDDEEMWKGIMTFTEQGEGLAIECVVNFHIFL
eukprot:jgi/Bigna1/79417/fgenesh1_pg.62_\